MKLEQKKPKNKITITFLLASIALVVLILGAVFRCLFMNPNRNKEDKDPSFYYMVEFDVNGGSPEIPHQIIEHGKFVDIPGEIFKANHIFEEWFPSIYEPIVKDMVFQAVWEEEVQPEETVREYIVMFNTMTDESSIKPQRVVEGKKARKPKDPKREGYEFVKWYPSVENTVIFEDTAFVAEWRRASDPTETSSPHTPEPTETTGPVIYYTVEFDNDGGFPKIPIQGVESGGKAKEPYANPQKTGYDFVGWSPDINETIIDEDIVFVALWEKKHYTVSFNTVGGSKVPNQLVEFEGFVVKPKNPEKTGFVFDGWTPSIEEPITESTIFTAKWRKVG